MEMYMKSLKNSKEKGFDLVDQWCILDFFKNHKVIIVKLNHCMNDSWTDTTQFDAYMQLSADGDFMQIVKKVPLRNMFI